jgi:DNA (cytosine-5)-methyltransferase 1
MTDRPLVLSLFPGIGLLDMAFEEEGFCVVRGPDLLWGGDVKRFHPPAGKFDGVIGGPPCQHWSALAHLVRANGYEVAPDMIPEFVRVVHETEPIWFLMENVPGAPVPTVCDYGVGDRLIRDVWVGGVTNRLRRFSFGRRGLSNFVARTFDIEVLALHTPNPELAVLASGGHREVPAAIGGSGLKKRTRKTRHTGRHLSGDYFRKALRLQGLSEGFLSEAPFTVEGKIKAVGNGVPLPMGRAVARAVKQAMGYQLEATA